ncbi:MAG: gliding motility-associated C-terminal domain-containing protein [Saprospiraceae bacterium]|nr:gliding motility-associated C-terminal domain-containing protein [Saprospiraceae bacterium]
MMKLSTIKGIFCLFCLFVIPKITAQMAVKIVGDKGFCPNEAAILSTDSVFTQYLWSNNQTTRSIAVSQPGRYSVVVLNTEGDTLRDTVIVQAFGLPNPTIGGTPYICPNRPTTVFVEQTDYQSYTWSNGESSRQIQVSQVGSYSVSVVDQNGCRNTTSISVSDGKPSNLPLPDSIKICQGDTALLDATAGDAVNYYWNTDDTTATITVRSAGMYNVIVSNGQCVSYDTCHVLTLPKPEFDLGKDTMLCQKDTLTLKGPENELYSYLWQNGSTAITQKVSDVGVYSLSVNFGNCRVSDTLMVKVFNKKNGVVLDTVICTPQYQIEPKVEGATYYQWTDGSTQPFLNISKSGTYQCLAYNGRCYADLSYKFKFLKNPNINFTKDTIICTDLGTKHLNLNAYWEGAKYVWNTGDTTPSVTATKTGLYYVAILNACGAWWTSSFVDFKSCYASFIPTAFSPNGDGENETFRIYPASNIAKVRSFQVFDRWGNRVFAAKDFDPLDAEKNAWDGKLNGQALKTDVFVYYLEIETAKGEVYFQKGDVTLLR